MQEIQRITPVGVDPRALGSYAPRMNKREDHGPYYLISPGEPVHRVEAKDSVPHLYPMVVTPCTSWGSWHYLDTASDNVAITATNADGQNVYFNPLYAGSIMESVCTAPGNFAYLGAINIEAFQGLKADELDIDAFNQLILPEPVWFGNDDLPPVHRLWYAQQYPSIEKTVRENGAMAVREMFLAQAMQRMGEVPIQLRGVYSRAIVEIQSACARFRKWADIYLAAQDREVKDTKSDKGTYDDRDVRLQWLMARPAADVQTQPVLQVQMPQAAADVERRECDNCGELIAVKAKACRYCGVKIQAESIVVSGEQVPTDTNMEKPKRGPGRPARVQLTDEPVEG